MGFKTFHHGEFSHRNDAKSHLEERQDRSNVDLPLRRTRILLACLGAIPCLLERPYWPSWNVRRSCFLYCITVYVIASLYFAWVWIAGKKQYTDIDESDVIARTIKLENILMTLPHVLGIILWFDVKNVFYTMKSFTKVQVTFMKATGKKLQNRRNKLEKILVTLAFCTPTFLFASSMLIVGYQRENAFMGPSILYGNIIISTFCVYFIGISVRIYDAAEDMGKEFGRHLMKRDVTATMVFDCRLAWLSMRTVLDSMDALQFPAVAHSIGVLLTVVLLYEGAALFKMGEITTAVGHVATSLFYIGNVVFTCRASHYAQEKMKNFVRDILPTIKLSSYDIGIQREVVMLYLIENARPAVTNLGGMVVVNKHLIVLFWSNVLTYIIVLLQVFQTNSFAI